MASITSTTESWNNHLFSEVESYIKSYYSLTSHTHDYSNTYAAKSHTHSEYMISGNFSTIDTETVGWGTLTGSTYTPLLRLTSPSLSSDSGCIYIAYRNVAANDTKNYAQIDGYFYQNEGKYRVTDVSDFKTINGQSIIGSGDITIGGGGGGAYLPLTGGTIYNGSANYPFNINSSSSSVWMYFCVGGNEKTSMGYWNGIAFLANEYGNHPRIGILDNGTVIYRPSTESETYYKVHHDGIGASFNGSIEIHSDGNSWSEGVRIHPAENDWGGIVFCEKSNSGSTNTSYNTWSIHNHEGEFAITKSGSSESNAITYIVNTDSSTWKFKTNIIATGGITALSDARHKKVINDTDITVEQIAEMPSVFFKWTDGEHDDKTYVGTLAQSWKPILPQVVLESENEEKTLSFNYGVAALVSSITTARDVVSIKEKIKSLEDEIVKLKEKL